MSFVTSFRVQDIHSVRSIQNHLNRSVLSSAPLSSSLPPLSSLSSFEDSASFTCSANTEIGTTSFVFSKTSTSSFSFLIFRPPFLGGVAGVGGLLFNTDTGTPPALGGVVRAGAGLLRLGLERAGLLLTGDKEEEGGDCGVSTTTPGTRATWGHWECLLDDGRDECTQGELPEACACACSRAERTSGCWLWCLFKWRGRDRK